MVCCGEIRGTSHRLCIRRAEFSRALSKRILNGTIKVHYMSTLQGVLTGHNTPPGYNALNAVADNLTPAQVEVDAQ